MNRLPARCGVDMLAADTNVVVRLVIADHPEQYEAVQAFFESQVVWIPKTVILESDWVLRSAYGFSRDQAVAALQSIMRIQSVVVEDGDSVLRALDWASNGLDFADALHIASSDRADGFVTFDRDLVKKSNRQGLPRIHSVS